MFETVVIATDGSASAERAVEVALDFADRFGATVHACYVLDTGEMAGPRDEIADDIEAALESAGEEALSFVREEGAESLDGEVVTAVREGDPAIELVDYAREHDADLIATGTRGRHGEHSFLLGSVAESVVRESPIPVLTVRQLEADDPPERPG